MHLKKILKKVFMFLFISSIVLLIYKLLFAFIKIIHLENSKELFFTPLLSNMTSLQALSLILILTEFILILILINDIVEITQNDTKNNLKKEIQKQNLKDEYQMSEAYYDFRYPSSNKINAEGKRIGKLLLAHKKEEKEIILSYKNDICSKINLSLKRDESSIFMRIISYVTFFYYDVTIENSNIILRKWK